MRANFSRQKVDTYVDFPIKVGLFACGSAGARIFEFASVCVRINLGSFVCVRIRYEEELYHQITDLILYFFKGSGFMRLHAVQSPRDERLRTRQHL